MQAKTIKFVLRRKVDQWIASITNEPLRELVKQNVIVTGGSIVSMLMQEPVNDYDVYLRTGECAFRVAEYYVEKFKQNRKEGKVELILVDAQKRELKQFAGDRFRIMAQSAGVVSDGDSGQANYQYFEMTDPDGAKSEAYLDDAVDKAKETKDDKGEFRPVFLSSNAITLSDKVQIIIRFWGEPEEIHKNYDFVHCTSYWTSWDSQLTLNPAALEAILSKTLTYVGSLYPICSVIRTRKFLNRGWRITAGQYLRMCMQIGDLNLNDINVLEDQLTGVDAAYFAELIGALRKHMEETGSKDIDRTYLSQLIDRIF